MEQNERDIRDRALALAAGAGEQPAQTLERAEKYRAFLAGETGSTQTPLPIGEGDQPDALHG